MIPEQVKYVKNKLSRFELFKLILLKWNEEAKEILEKSDCYKYTPRVK